MDPNIQIISESQEVEEDKNWWKILLIFVINAAILIGTVYNFKIYLTKTNNFNLLFFCVLFFLLLVFSILEVFLIKGKWKIFFFTLIEAFLPLTLFINQIKTSYPQLIRILVVFSLLSFYLIFIAKLKGIEKLSNSLKIKFFETTKVILPKLSSGFLIIFIVIWYFVFFEWQIGSPNAEKILITNLTSVASTLSRLISPNLMIAPNKKMDNIVQEVALLQLKTNKLKFNTNENTNVNLSFNQLPTEMKKQILTMTVNNIEKELKSKFDFFSPQQTVEEFVYLLYKKYFNYFSSTFGGWTYIVLAFLIFLIGKSVFTLFYWLIKLFAFIIFKLLVAFGFVYITLETKAREFILLS